MPSSAPADVHLEQICQKCNLLHYLMATCLDELLMTNHPTGEHRFPSPPCHSHDAHFHGDLLCCRYVQELSLGIASPLG